MTKYQEGIVTLAFSIIGWSISFAVILLNWGTDASWAITFLE